MRIFQQVLYTLIFLIGISLNISSAAAIYVKHDAIGANDGTSWTDAYTNLETALKMNY